jgi:uncharacterized protein YcaQ
MNPVTLTLSQARSIILHAAGLSKPAQFGKGPEAVYKLIEQLGFLQIDTNYVVERAHHHAIYARVPNYQLEWLDQLQRDGRIFEFWTFAAGYIPMHHFRYSLPVKKAFLTRRGPVTQMEMNLMKSVLDRIAREGPLMARDFENDRLTKSTGWWDWRPSKVALERLHLEGKIMTSRKGNFQKVYDLTENLLPSGIDQSMPSESEFARHVIIRSLKAMGIAYLKEIVFTARYVPNTVKTEIQKMVDEGIVSTVKIEGLKGSTLYMLPVYHKKKIKITGDCFILSPFDILNVFRHRLRDFFHFDYQVECFVPKPKRKYGYFSLPILIGDTFIARMDSKADRKERMYLIHNLHLEKVKLTNQMITKLVESIKAFATFNQCDQILIEKCNQAVIAKELKKRLAGRPKGVQR